VDERPRRTSTDPSNLHRTMPAKGGEMPAEHAEAAVVLAGGDPVAPRVRSLLPGGAIVIAADSGLHQAALLDLEVDLIVGDLDSVDPAALEASIARGARVERHPIAKDETDLELALRAASLLHVERVFVVGGAGGRLDHFLANLVLLASPQLAHLEIEALVGSARVRPIHEIAELHGKPGDLVTLLALGGPARGVRTTGLAYPLDGEDLLPGSTRGVSNELCASSATVSLSEGVVLAVQPLGEW